MDSSGARLTRTPCSTGCWRSTRAAHRPRRSTVVIERLLHASRRIRRTQAAAGDPCRGHQREGLDHRLACGRSWRRTGLARRTSTPRPTSCASTSASAIGAIGERPLRARGRSSLDALAELRGGQRGRADHRTSRSPPAAALLAVLANPPPTWLLLEVGLGGRVDATNVDRPAGRLPCDDARSVDRPRRIPRRHGGGRDRRREGRHLQVAACPAIIGRPGLCRGRRWSVIAAHAEAAGRDRSMARRQPGLARSYAERGRLVYQDETRPVRPAPAPS